MMKPIVHGLEAQYGEKIQFTYLDVDDPATAELRQTLRFRGQPQFLLLDGQGNILQQWFGFVAGSDFEAVFTGLAP